MTNVLEFKPLIDDPGLSESQPKRICLKKDEDLTKEVKIALEFLPTFLFNVYAFLCTLCIFMNN